MERISPIQKRGPQIVDQKNSFPLLGFSLVFVLLLSLSTYVFFQQAKEKIQILKMTPWNPDHPCEHAFISFSPELSEIQDSILPVKAKTHLLMRKVYRYQNVPQEQHPKPMPVPAASLNRFFFKTQPSSSLSTLPSDSFYPVFYTHGRYRMNKTSLGDSEYYQKSDHGELSFEQNDSKNSLWRFLYPNRIFIGRDIQDPRQGELLVTYDSLRLQPLEIYGSIDQNFEIHPHYISSANNTDLRAELIGATQAIIMHSWTLFALSCCSLCLFVLRETISPKSYQRFFQHSPYQKPFEALALIVIAFLPKNLFSAVFLAISLLAYFSMKKWLELAVILKRQERVDIYG